MIRYFRHRLISSSLSMVVLLTLLTACSTLTQNTMSATTALSHPTLTPQPTGTATQAVTPSPSLAGWNLIWDAEFDGNALNTSQWQPVDSAIPSTVGCCVQYADEAWSPRNVTVSDGVLHLVTTDQPSGDYHYTSGAVTTLGRFALKYGRIDIRAKLPTTEGLWPAAWLLPVSSSAARYSPYEIDMIEAWGSQPSMVHFFFHWPGNQIGCVASGPNYTTGYHVFTLIWTSTLIEWQVDGTTRCIATNNIPQTPMYLIFSAAIDGGLEHTNASTILPQSFDIDYVRVWSAGN